MQGPNYLDLARTLAEEHLQGHNHPRPPPPEPTADSRHGPREWIGLRLIGIGERLTPNSTELKPQVSAGPPCP